MRHGKGDHMVWDSIYEAKHEMSDMFLQMWIKEEWDDERVKEQAQMESDGFTDQGYYPKMHAFIPYLIDCVRVLESKLHGTQEALDYAVSARDVSLEEADTPEEDIEYIKAEEWRPPTLEESFVLQVQHIKKKLKKSIKKWASSL